jgi:hypothetical protein
VEAFARNNEFVRGEFDNDPTCAMGLRLRRN